VNVVPGDPSSKKVAKQPNSFVYRFVPYDRTNLQAGGQLYALQVTIDGEPVVFNAGDPVGDTFSSAQLKLHTPGTTWPAAWVLIHDTAVNGFGSFDSNAAAKANAATPFKRPENGQFLPGSNFRTFFFCPTGDTNSDSGVQPALAARGAWGSIFRADFKGGLNGTVSIVVLGDSVHNSFDNLAFADTQTLLATEDRGDGLHKQLNTLDSVWAFDIRGGATPPRRFIALGRDTASAADAALLDANTPGFQNEGDNEPTGLHISDGSPAIGDLLGSHVSQQNAHWFVTQQHGLNQVWEIVH
jgi:secreted PhoX family phosphatase